MTYGEELLRELGKLLPVDSYFSAEQQEQLRQVHSKDGLKDALDRAGVSGVSTEGDIPDVAANVAFVVRFDLASWGLGLDGCLLIPFTFQARWLIDAARTGNLRFSLAEILAFIAMVAVGLSYEVSIAPVYLGMPQQLLLALPVALLLGALPSYLFKNPRWVIVSFDVIVLMEVVAFVVWCRA